MIMDKKKQANHDADYDRWGSAPGSIRITKKKAAKPKKTTKKK